MKNALQGIWKEVTMVYSKYYLSIFLEGPSNIMITFRLAKHSHTKVYTVIATPACSAVGQQMLGPRVGTRGDMEILIGWFQQNDRSPPKQCN
jgi:hypothetical protein